MEVSFNSNIFTQRNTVHKALKSQHPAPLKSDVVMFCGSKDFLSLSKNEIFSRIETTVNNPANKLGQGGEAVVYKIPDTDYCVRLDYDTVNYKNNLSFKLTEQDKINHVVARLGGKSTIMKYLEGSPVLSYNMTVTEAREAAKIVDQLPAAPFRKLLHQICHAKKFGMTFDCTYPNVIVNPKEKTLTAIDFYKSNELFRPLSQMYVALAHHITSMEQRKHIAGKIIKAAMEEFQVGQKPCISPNHFDFSRLTFNLGGKDLAVKVIENFNYTKLLGNLFAQIQELKFKEIRGIDVTQSLTCKLKAVNCLIKQLFDVL